MTARTLAGLRRLIARIGADTAARPLPVAIPATIHRAAAPEAAAHTAPPLTAHIAAHTVPTPAAHAAGGAVHITTPAARAAAIGTAWHVPTHAARPLPTHTPHAAAAAIPAGAARRADPRLPPPGVHAIPPAAPAPPGAAAAGAHAVRRMRRTPIAWTHITPDRLRAAWQAILADHGHPGTDLELVGVYGPLPVNAITTIAVAADRRATLGLAPDTAPPTAGDLALARHTPTGRLLHSAGQTHTEVHP